MADPSELDAIRSMSAYGTDSLVAVEMKNLLEVVMEEQNEMSI